MDYLVSIIIPVFNVEKYLRKCIDSVINQTLKNIEIIIVDDGSTDHSGQICDEYATKDKRIHVLHKANEGLSSARNDGIKMSNAPFILFVDGDDWVEPNFCELPYKIACENNVDLVLFSYKKIYTDGTMCNFETNRESGFLTEAEAIHYNAFNCWAVWIGLYSRRIFNKVQFPDGKLHEDTGTSHRFIHEAKTIYFLNSCLYDYRVDRVGSIMNDSTTREHPDLREMLTRKAFDLYCWGYKDYSQLYALRVLVRYGLQIDDEQKLRGILNVGNAPKFFDWKYKGMFYLHRLCPLMFDTICKATDRRKHT